MSSSNDVPFSPAPQYPSTQAATRLEDLARLAGVSIATISRALNDSPVVNEATKKRIWKLARDHNYAFKPHMPATLSKAAATITIALPTPQARESRIADPFYMELVAGVAEAARNEGCNVLISPAVPQTFDELCELVDTNRSEGLIFLGQGSLHERFNRLMEHDRRFVVWGAELQGQRYCSVGSDNLAGGRRATAHLIRLGRRNVAFLGDVDAPEVRQRFDGYCQALSEAGLPFREDLVMPVNFELNACTGAVSSLLAAERDLDGIVAAGDLIAISAIRALRQAGRRIPEEVSVVGYDDILLARYHTPMITTVSQDMLAAGRLMVGKLLFAADRQPLTSERIQTDLVVRESCGA